MADKLKQPKIEGEADIGLSNIPESKGELLAFVKRSETKIQRVKNKISVLEKKLAKYSESLQFAEAKIANINRHDDAMLSKNEESHPAGEASKTSLLVSPSPSKRKVSATMRPEENGTKAQPATGRELVVVKEGRSISDNDIVTPKSKRSRIEIQGRDNFINKSTPKSIVRGSSSTSQGALKEQYESPGHIELAKLIGKSPLLSRIQGRTENMIPSCHEKRLRSLALCPSNHELFATSALDGTARFWQLQTDGQRHSLDCLKATNRIPLDRKRWAEDIAWHPRRPTLFSVYPTDDGHPQISVLDLNEGQRSCKLALLEDKPHTKGRINRIMFMPWNNASFVTGGSDHAVVLWSEGEENMWKPRRLHEHIHSSAVMGVAGMQHNSVVLSCGDDRKLVGFDARAEKLSFKHWVDNRCTDLLPNPCDFNVVMVQTRQMERQVRLYDIRVPKYEVFTYGWKQSSESHSALIKQCWSPDGFYISSGSADPMIHIFDIRYNAPIPCHSIKTHRKRVFKAEWHPSLALLLSISSDSDIGLHKLQ